MTELARIPRRVPGRTRPTSYSVASRKSFTSSTLSVAQFTDPATQATAQRISDLIDEDIKREAVRRQSERRKEVKVMLLGQAESGKSTLQKQFQLYHASHTLEVERPSWRIVVYANLIKAVRTILAELDYEFSLSLDEYPWTSEGSAPTDVSAQNEILELRRNLLPLISLEGSLLSELSEGISFVGHRRGTLFPPRKGMFTRSGTRPVTDLRDSTNAIVAVNRAAQVLGMTVHVIEALWRHRSVEHMLRARKLRLDESGLFFLSEVRRIAQPDYIPSTDDMLHVRLQTVGVIEHSMKVNTVGGNYIWRIYDVGGTRSQRPAWCSYFDDVNALIFLAPISAFDQYLEDDPLTNRIHDSVELLTSICANKLLKDAQLILLLNKVDILRKKLESGVQIRQYIVSYGNRPNNYSTAAEYFRTHFLAAHKKKDTFQRRLYVHFTTMLDVQATQIIIASVEDLIMRKHIVQTGLM
ncbi:guanine nucleotide binding protein, alpha subunit [Mycena albidolilacea]|uniref:Guanine nucleotide binding protein, alpha subunit n=1 Tax=Mycena albidolilacea TaxID=1033008 RepID=A0AAD7AC35_9AGAR|nr:guanine nucleotide binding protein, alpha subunit [Mycena albidolilacea]